MFEVRRAPNFDFGSTAANNPRAKGENLGDCLNATLRDLQFVDLLSALENPDTTIASTLLRSICSQNMSLPCRCRRDILRSLRSSCKNKIQTFSKVVGLKTAAGGGCDLKGRLSKRNGSEGNFGGRYKAYSLYHSVRFNSRSTGDIL